jgi:CBS domain-containing protein
MNVIDQSVAKAMARSVSTITEETTASEIAGLFAERGIGSAVVVDPDTDAPIGIVTESDIMRQVALSADITSVHAGSFMSAPVITTSSDESIHKAASLMKEHSIRRLLVVDDDDIVGMLTTTDLTHYLPRLRNTILRDRDDLVGQ